MQETLSMRSRPHAATLLVSCHRFDLEHTITCRFLSSVFTAQAVYPGRAAAMLLPCCARKHLQTPLDTCPCPGRPGDTPGRRVPVAR
jgi:hypothetical protein